MPNRLTLSPTAQAVIEQEASRIAQLGNAWQPTPENLTEVVKAVLAVEEARFKKQAEGPLEAQEAKPSIGRPSLEIPPAFEALYRRNQAGELRIEDVTCMLGISRHTYYKWVKTLQSEGAIASREKKEEKPSAERRPSGRPKKKTEADKVRLLAFLQDSAPGPKSMTVRGRGQTRKRRRIDAARRTRRRLTSVFCSPSFVPTNPHRRGPWCSRSGRSATHWAGR